MAGKREAPQQRTARGESRRQSARATNRYEEPPRARQTYYEDDYSQTRRNSRGGSDRGDAYSSSEYDGTRRPSGRGGGGKPPKGGRGHKKRRMPGWQKAIIIILAVLIVLMSFAVAAVMLVNGKLDRIKRIDMGNETQTSENFDQDAEGDDTVTDDQLQFADTKVDPDSDVVNFMLIGRDTGTMGDEVRTEERGRSDSMMVVSLNRKTKQISIVSLMRDCYVKIPGYKNNKLNAAFSFGGYELMDQTVEENFGIHIDHNVGINFDGFQLVVDKLDGIDVTLTAGEAEYMALWGFPDMVEGVNHLNGEQALAYARSRYVGTGKEANDFGRTYRQRVVVTQVFKELMSRPINEIMNILNDVMGCVETDITSNADIMSYAYEVYNYGIDDLQAYRLPQDGEYQDETINKMAVLTVDWDKAQQHLKDWLYSDTPLEVHNIDAAN